MTCYAPKPQRQAKLKDVVKASMWNFGLLPFCLPQTVTNLKNLKPFEGFVWKNYEIMQQLVK